MMDFNNIIVLSGKEIALYYIHVFTELLTVIQSLTDSLIYWFTHSWTFFMKGDLCLCVLELIQSCVHIIVQLRKGMCGT